MPAPNDLPPAATAPQAIGGDVEVLRRLVEGTVRSTGEEFFRSLVRNLSLALGSPYALVAEFAGSPSRVRTLAYWGKGAFLDDIEYDLAGTPCEDVARGELCHHPDSVQQRFPNDRPLAAMGIESYIGVPLFDGQGEVLGHLAVFDTAPTRDVERGISILQIFAARAAACSCCRRVTSASMRASPSAVTRFGCGEIGRSGSSSTASSSSLTNALLMRAP